MVEAGGVVEAGQATSARGGESLTRPGAVLSRPARDCAGPRIGILEGLRDAGPVAVAGFASNGANVLVTVFVARLLTTRGYGALAQLTSLFLVVSMPGTAVLVGVVRRVTELATFGDRGTVGDWARRVHSRGTAVVLAVTVLVLATRAPLAHLLSIPAPLGVFAVLVAGAVWVLLSLDRGLLQSQRAYRTLSVNLLVEGGVRTAAVVCLVASGLGVAGAAWGILIAEVVTAIHARWAADRAWRSDPSWGASPRWTSPQTRLRSGSGNVLLFGARGTRRAQASLRRLFLDVAAALVAMALLAYLQNVDVIVLGREAPHASGTYAAISVASKALVFGAIALGGYLLPEAAIEWHRGGHALRQLWVTLLMLAVPGTVLLSAAVVFPRQLLSIAFSGRYVGAHSAFWLLALAMVFLSATVVMTFYLLAAGQRWIGSLLFVGAVVATVSIAAAHGSPRLTAATDLFVQGALATLTAAVFAVVHTRRAAGADGRMIS